MTNTLCPVLLLVTRPEAAARKLLPPLAEHGIQALAWPAFDLLPPEDPHTLVQAVQDLQAFDTIIFVSPAAVHAFALAYGQQAKPTSPLSWPSHLRVATVGHATAQAVLTALPQVDPAHLICPPGLSTDQGGSEALIQAWPSTLAPPRSALLVRAQKGRQRLRLWITEQGGKVQDLVAYRRLEHTPSEPDWAVLSQKLSQGFHLAVLFTSTEAVEVLVKQFAAQPAFAYRYRSLQALCVHGRIAEALRGHGFEHISECALEPTAIAEALRRGTPSWMVPPRPLDILV